MNETPSDRTRPFKQDSRQVLVKIAKSESYVKWEFSAWKVHLPSIARRRSQALARSDVRTMTIGARAHLV